MIFGELVLPRMTGIGRGQKRLYLVVLLILFWAIFDGLLAYILPIRITDLGFTTAQMGLIIASSNVFGAIFDFVLAKYLTNTNYRRLFLLIYGLCFIYPLLLWQSKALPLFLLSMAVWGLYGDLHNYALFDFVNRRIKTDNYSHSFGVIEVFKCLGYLIAPIIAGLVVTELVDFFPFSLSLSFVMISFIFYLILVDLSPKKDLAEYDQTSRYAKYNIIKEFKIIKSVGKILSPVLAFNTLLHVFDGAIWTIGPLYAMRFAGYKDFGGFFMTAYTLPSIFMGLVVGKLTFRYGKKMTAYWAFFISCLFMIPIGFIDTPIYIFILIFLSSMGSALSWPAIKAAYADYIHESKSYYREIESLSDFSSNLGYIIGPALAGMLAGWVGVHNLFTVLAVLGIVAVEILFFITPKNISVVVHRKENGKVLE